MTNAMRPIDPKQVQRIKMLTKALDMDDDTYRDMLRTGYGHATCTALTMGQAAELINKLTGMAVSAGVWKPYTGSRQPGHAKPHENLRGRQGNFASPGQVRLIEVLWKIVSRETSDAVKRRTALDHFLQRRFNIIRLESVEAKQVPKVVAALRTMESAVHKKSAEKAQEGVPA